MGEAIREKEKLLAKLNQAKGHIVNVDTGEALGGVAGVGMTEDQFNSDLDKKNPTYGDAEATADRLEDEAADLRADIAKLQAQLEGLKKDEATATPEQKAKLGEQAKKIEAQLANLKGRADRLEMQAAAARAKAEYQKRNGITFDSGGNIIMVDGKPVRVVRIDGKLFGIDEAGNIQAWLKGEPTGVTIPNGGDLTPKALRNHPTLKKYGIWWDGKKFRDKYGRAVKIDYLGTGSVTFKLDPNDKSRVAPVMGIPLPGIGFLPLLPQLTDHPPDGYELPAGFDSAVSTGTEDVDKWLAENGIIRKVDKDGYVTYYRKDGVQILLTRRDGKWVVRDMPFGITDYDHNLDEATRLQNEEDLKQIPILEEQLLEIEDKENLEKLNAKIAAGESLTPTERQQYRDIMARNTKRKLKDLFDRFGKLSAAQQAQQYASFLDEAKQVIDGQMKILMEKGVLEPAIQKELEELQKALDSAKGDMGKTQQEVKDARAALAKARDILRSISERDLGKVERIEKIKDQIAALRGSMEKKKEQLQKLQAKCPDYKGLIETRAAQAEAKAPGVMSGASIVSIAGAQVADECLTILDNIADYNQLFDQYLQLQGELGTATEEASAFYQAEENVHAAAGALKEALEKYRNAVDAYYSTSGKIASGAFSEDTSIISFYNDRILPTQRENLIAQNVQERFRQLSLQFGRDLQGIKGLIGEVRTEQENFASPEEAKMYEKYLQTLQGELDKLKAAAPPEPTKPEVAKTAAEVNAENQQLFDSRMSELKKTDPELAAFCEEMVSKLKAKGWKPGVDPGDYSGIGLKAGSFVVGDKVYNTRLEFSEAFSNCFPQDFQEPPSAAPTAKTQQEIRQEVNAILGPQLSAERPLLTIYENAMNEAEKDYGTDSTQYKDAKKTYSDQQNKIKSLEDKIRAAN
ncbi:hypothetical protein KY326_03965, partial [Candidatus Woesearchaeota archaeon]|nr:hypothetical protein [Candidatus Woesearchaeota archaeon]